MEHPIASQKMTDRIQVILFVSKFLKKYKSLLFDFLFLNSWASKCS